MRAWFASLPIDRKLVVTALLVMVPAFVLGTVGLTLVDLLRYRQSVRSDTMSLAGVIAETTAAAVVFDDQDDASQTLSALRTRPTVRRACLYLPSGRLFAGFAREASLACEPVRPEPRGWTLVPAAANVSSNGKVIGTVYIEQDLGGIWARLVATALVDAVMLAAIGLLAVALADRLHRSISKPIAELATAARAIQADPGNLKLPQVDSGIGEVGELAGALSGMLRRLGDVNEQLRRREKEREDLLAREREASRLKDEFLASVSHELRTPLSAIVGWAQILNSGVVSDEMLSKGLASISRNARAQARLIEDLVDVSRVVTGKLRLRMGSVDLHDVIASAVEVIRPSARAKRLHISVDAPPAGCPVRGDRDRLQQVVANLLSNAVKFTPEGGSVSIALRDLGSGCEVVVSDTGVGIKPSFLPFVFDRFRQADGSLTREHGGLGLGLAIVKQIAELHGGSVEALSPGPGQGATFIVRLPAITDVVEPAAAPADAGAPVRPDVLKGVRILVADDNLDAAEVLGAALTSAGATVRIATSGASAVAEWERESADLLLCDLAMPGLDGFEVLRRIRTHDAQFHRRTRAIAVSAHATEEHTARSLAEGFAGHVTKPFQVPELLRTISDVLTPQSQRS